MEKAQLFFISLLALKHHEVVGKLIALNKGMSHLNAFSFHWVLLAEVIIGYRVVIEVTHLPHFLSIKQYRIKYHTSNLYYHELRRSPIPNLISNHSRIYIDIHRLWSVYSIPWRKSQDYLLTLFTQSKGMILMASLKIKSDIVILIMFDLFWLLDGQDALSLHFRSKRLLEIVMCLLWRSVVEDWISLWFKYQSQNIFGMLSNSRLFYVEVVILKKQLKNLPQENHQDIIKKYDQVFPKLNGKIQDTIILGRVLQFGNYIKKILPVLTNFKEIALSFIEAKNANSQQFTVLLNYVLPQYEKSCLSVYCNQITQGKYIFNEANDQRLANLASKLKELLKSLQFQELYFNLQQEEREMEAFIQTYKVRDSYESKLKELKGSQKDLQLQVVKLNAGKQGFFSSFKGNIQSNKEKTNKKLQTVRQDIKLYQFLVRLIALLLGYYEVERFRRDKLHLYFQTIKKIAIFQKELNRIKGEICQHILENHNLL